MPPSNDRALEIDGIRGWASFFVLLYHSFHEMLTAVLPWINSPWFAPIFDGRIAVCVFFVLSGDALSSNFLVRGAVNPTPIDRLLVRRYTRLTIPILMSCLLVFLLRLAHADWHAEAAEALNRSIWLRHMIEFPFSIIDVLRYSLLGVYTSHSNATSYNPFLWTMSVEMIGSMLVFLTCYVWPRLLNPKAVVGSIALLLFAMNSFLCLFFAGVYLGLLRNDSFFRTVMAGRGAQIASLAGFVGLLLMLVAIYGRPMPLFFDLAVAVAMVFVLYSQRNLRNFLRGRLSTWLGEVSFPIYLVQFSMLISLESWLAVEWRTRGLGQNWLVLIGLATVAATLLLGSGFRWVERISLAAVDVRVLRLLRKG